MTWKTWRIFVYSHFLKSVNFTRVLPSPHHNDMLYVECRLVAHQMRVSLLSVSPKRTNYVHNKVESGVSHNGGVRNSEIKIHASVWNSLHWFSYCVLALAAFGKLASDKRAYFRSFSWKIKSSFCLIYLSVCIPLWRQIRGLAAKTFISHFIDRVTQ